MVIAVQVIMLEFIGSILHFDLTLMHTAPSAHTAIPAFSAFPFFRYQLLLDLFDLVSLTVEICLFIWLYRSMDTAALLGYPATFRPYWGVLSWLIPFANFVLPYFCIQDCFRPGIHRGAPWKGLFWAAYLIQGIAALPTVAVALLNYRDPERYLPFVIVESAVIGIIVATAGLLLITHITEDHLDAVAKLEARRDSPQEPAAPQAT